MLTLSLFYTPSHLLKVICRLLVFNLGVTKDPTLSFILDIAKFDKSIFFNLHNVAKMCTFVNQKTTETLVHALITLCFNYRDLFWQACLLVLSNPHNPFGIWQQAYNSTLEI